VKACIVADPLSITKLHRHGSKQKKKISKSTPLLYEMFYTDSPRYADTIIYLLHHATTVIEMGRTSPGNYGHSLTEPVPEIMDTTSYFLPITSIYQALYCGVSKCCRQFRTSQLPVLKTPCCCRSTSQPHPTLLPLSPIVTIATVIFTTMSPQ
jgi:hypothetical protein